MGGLGGLSVVFYTEMEQQNIDTPFYGKVRRCTRLPLRRPKSEIIYELQCILFHRSPLHPCLIYQQILQPQDQSLIIDHRSNKTSTPKGDLISNQALYIHQFHPYIFTMNQVSKTSPQSTITNHNRWKKVHQVQVQYKPKILCIANTVIAEGGEIIQPLLLCGHFRFTLRCESRVSLVSQLQVPFAIASQVISHRLYMIQGEHVIHTPEMKVND